MSASVATVVRMVRGTWRWWLVLPAWAICASAGPVLGPRVDLRGPLTWQETFDAVGRQLNRHIGLLWSEDPRRTQPSELNLAGATQAEALAALERLTGLRARRREHWSWALAADGPAAPVATSRVDAWRIGLDDSSCTRRSALVPGAPGPPTLSQAQQLTFSLVADSDPDALALVDWGELSVLDAAGQPFEARGSLNVEPLPAPVSLTVSLELDPLGKRFPARLSYALLLAPLRVDTLRCDLPAVGASVDVAGGDLRGTVKRTETGRLKVLLDRPRETAPTDSQPAARRLFDAWMAHMVEGRLSAADGRGLYTVTQTTARNPVPGEPARIRMEINVALNAEDVNAQPACLALEVTRRSGPPVARRVVFENLPALALNFGGRP